MWGRCSASLAHRALPVSGWPVQGMSWATARSNTSSAVYSMCGGACTGCYGRAGQVVHWGCGFTVCWSFPDVEAPLGNQSDRDLPVCGWSALVIPCATTRSNAASAVRRRCSGACTGCYGRAGQVISGGCGLTAFWSFSVEEAPLGNHSAQSPDRTKLASPGHAMGHCKVRCSLCIVHQVWWGLHWRL